MIRVAERLARFTGPDAFQEAVRFVRMAEVVEQMQTDFVIVEDNNELDRGWVAARIRPMEVR